ncbi:MAG: ATP-binding cassette domain-containing protein [Proteobacteria bacterium]|nr:ATP-binding cassette domain-containing protein [Pseudomonadota bacterium]
MSSPLLEIDGLRMHFSLRRSSLFRAPPTIHAVNGVSLTVLEGETLAVVGESGCGKTTLGRAIVGLLPLASGRIRFRGLDLAAASRAQLKAARRAVQMVFQDPFSSLDPRMTVADIIAEPLVIHRMGSVPEHRARARQLIELVGLPVDSLGLYPHQFSGGQRQRIAIARALGPMPDLIIADEPLSSLDVSVQSQILNLLADLRDREHLSYLLISHDLGVVHHLADRVAIMYLGHLVEIGGPEDIFDRPSHPYTQALLRAIPRIGQGKRRTGGGLKGDIPSPIQLPEGCAFHPRCPKAQALCRQSAPTLDAAPGRSGHLAACHFKD